VNGVVQELWEVTPRGGFWSPLLSNIFLKESNKELDRKGHRFCQYAADANIYAKSKLAGEKVLASIERLLNKRLRLCVNREKSAVARYHERSLLGLGFTSEKILKVKINEKYLARFKGQVRGITRRSRGRSIPQISEEHVEYLGSGWDTIAW